MQSPALPLSPSSPMGVAQDSSFRYPPATFASSFANAGPGSRQPGFSSSEIHFASSRSFVSNSGLGGGSGGSVGINGSNGGVDRYGDSSNAPSTYAIALSSPLSARGKPPYFPDENGKSNKGFVDSAHGGILCNFCKNNGEREAMYR